MDMATFVRRFRWAAVAAAASVALVVAGVVLLARDSDKRSADPGAAACRMMAADAASGRMPDGTRSEREAQLLRSSSNADLLAAPAALSLAANGDGSVLAAMGKIYSGCAALGVPLTH